jgi:hypothetical protein
VLIENALRGAGGMPPTRGDGAVKGVVLDALGNPVPDVEIVATTDIWSLEEPPEGLDEEVDDTLEAQIRRLVWEHRFREATRSTARTGPDGTYQLTGLVAASYHVEPSLAGWRFTAPGDGDWNATPGDTQDFTAHPVVGVSVSVTLSDGTVPEDAHVWYGATGSGEQHSYTWTKEAEPLELGVGLYSFSATAGAHGAYAANEVPVEVSDDGQAVVQLRLEARPGVMGKVEFSGAERPLSVGIAALYMDAGDADPAHLMSAGHSAWVGDPFEFALLDLEKGAWLVGAVLRNGTVLDTAMLEIGDAPVEHTFHVGNVDVRDYVVVRPRSPDGSPVGELTFGIGYDAGEDLSFEGNLALAPEADGTYRVPVAVPGGPEDSYNGWSRSGEPEPGRAYSGVKYHITAQSPRFGTKRIEYDPLSKQPIDLEFSEPAFAVVTVSGYQSSSWRGRVEASLVPVGNGTQWGGTNWLSDDQRRMTPQGVARVGPVEPGTYKVTLMVLTQQNGYRPVADTEVILGIGDTGVSMALPELHELVMVVDGEPLDLDLHRDPDLGETTDFLDEGVMEGRRTTFTALAPGRYRIRHYGEGSTGEMLVDVPAAGAVPFRPVEYNALRVDNVPEGLQGILQQGDVIVGIGDSDMDGERRVRAALALAGTQDTVQLTVRRGAREMEIEAPSAQLEEGYLIYWVR